MAGDESGAARVLVLWYPDWPITATGGAAAGEVAVVADGRVLACSDGARLAGVRRGQRLRLAHRLCPELRLRERDPAAETRRFEPVLAAVEEFTPRVEVLRPGLCALAVKGPARYFGGEQELAALLYERLAELSPEPGPDRAGDWGGPARPPEQQPAPQTPLPRIGIADGVFAAVLAARAEVLVPAGRTAEFLAPYPVGVLADQHGSDQQGAGRQSADRQLAELLVRLGLPTLGDLARLPVHAVADRFGPAGLAAHRLARGLEARLPATRGPGPELAVEQLFDPPELLAEPLVFVGRTLAEQLHQQLAGAGLACRRVSVEVSCADGSSAARLWQHEGRLPPAALAERVRWQLQAWQTSGQFGPTAGGFTALRLVPDELVADHGRQLALWGQALAADRVERAAARVQALLGYGGLTRVERVGGRGPDEVLARVVWGEEPEAPADRDAPWPGRLGHPAPGWVPPEPVPVTVLDAAGQPVGVTGRAEVSSAPTQLVLAGRISVVTAWAGPWPAVERWWDPQRARRRARFQVTLADGRALLLVLEGGAWAVEGAYA
ncbi:DNA polymerase Y family protein [Streptomyces tateyamensis]|uniref:DNA polymerase Y family protein n=1 Tax=Streptomyces tateyamensis TaxID=565073 RepID=A0A2V4NCG1_9ACTN|nr:DNA polymerase Y family protein [Streptomyces tateyamensis]PYC76820.1 DNA polymerase Y family protein [Streptomyces tateyamensis]